MSYIKIVDIVARDTTVNLMMLLFACTELLWRTTGENLIFDLCNNWTVTFIQKAVQLKICM